MYLLPHCCSLPSIRIEASCVDLVNFSQGCVLRTLYNAWCIVDAYQVLVESTREGMSLFSSPSYPFSKPCSRQSPTTRSFLTISTFRGIFRPSPSEFMSLNGAGNLFCLFPFRLPLICLSQHPSIFPICEVLKTFKILF